MKHLWTLNEKTSSRIDTAEYEKEMRLSAEMMPPILADRSSPKIVDAKHQFAKKRFDDRFRWEPTYQIEKAIVEAIFVKGRCYPLKYQQNAESSELDAVIS